MKTIVLAALLLASLASFCLAEWVDGYYRKDGTYVYGYFRSERNNIVEDNYSYKSKPIIENYEYKDTDYNVWKKARKNYFDED